MSIEWRLTDSRAMGGFHHMDQSLALNVPHFDAATPGSQGQMLSIRHPCHRCPHVIRLGRQALEQERRCIRCIPQVQVLGQTDRKQVARRPVHKIQVEIILPKRNMHASACNAHRLLPKAHLRPSLTMSPGASSTLNGDVGMCRTRRCGRSSRCVACESGLMASSASPCTACLKCITWP